MQDLQIENVLPETDPNLETHDEDIMMNYSVRHSTSVLDPMQEVKKGVTVLEF